MAYRCESAVTGVECRRFGARRSETVLDGFGLPSPHKIPHSVRNKRCAPSLPAGQRKIVAVAGQSGARQGICMRKPKTGHKTQQKRTANESPELGYSWARRWSR